MIIPSHVVFELWEAILPLFLQHAMTRRYAVHRYDAIVDLTRSLNTMSEYPRDTQEQTRRILLSLFPAWLPPAFKVRAWTLSTGMLMPCSHDAEDPQTLDTARPVRLVLMRWRGLCRSLRLEAA